MNRESWPATTEVCSQSNRTLGGLQAHDSEVHAVAGCGNPPAKSSCTSAEVLAPATVGPKISSPISTGAASLLRWPCGAAGRNRLRVVGEIKIVGAANVAECVHQNDAVKPGAILRCGFDFGLILFVDFRADQRSGFFELLHALFEWGSALRSTRPQPRGRFAWCGGRGNGRWFAGGSLAAGPEAVPAARAWFADPGATAAFRRATRAFSARISSTRAAKLTDLVLQVAHGAQRFRLGGAVAARALPVPGRMH